MGKRVPTSIELTPADFTRRGFLKKSALTAMGTMLGADIVFGSNLPPFTLPLAFQQDDPLRQLGKHPELIVLNNKPWNIETPAHLLDDAITPANKMFVRNNGLLPLNTDPTQWTLTIDGESVRAPKTYTLADLQTKFRHYSYQLVIECGGNGRKEFNPPAKGNQWGEGAVHCAQWTGVRLKDVLQDVGLKSDAVYIGYYGADIHLNGDPNKVVISRGVPMAKALEDETLLAFQMNGTDIPVIHGAPLRLVIGGWPASVSGKWLKRIAVRNKVHDGPKMESPSYRVPCNPIEPGAQVDESNFCIIESMPVKSVITFPKSGAMINMGQTLPIRGHAWAGDLSVSKVEYSIDYGATWQTAELREPANRLAWQHFTAQVRFPRPGYYEVWAKATDSNGVSQPMVSPAWNPKGYLNNATHRIAVKVS